ncbi:DoxX family protein [Taibaiella sp. KBW10]|uniref:BT_3928 family protein n=1 Tax=Taibaiella sp. KBW10 TaxID=2153357 RepID=UPI000F5A7CC0|nr:BT_3928 family protein [Taibaiella sp. KBW10]RQO30892.1 DoxX family protein [Taibaiella sp. KBW10]
MNTIVTPKPRKAGFYILNIVRILVGVLFIFSGLVKANDPSGLAYKMDEFFEVWKMQAFVKYSLYISIAMITFEILAGIAMLIGYAYRSVSFLILLLTIFFTFLTGYAVFSGKIKECGCFGDCIPLEAYQSFIKDLILLILVFLLFLGRNQITGLFKKQWGTAVIFVGLIATLGIQFYALRHLPYVDCLAYKVGVNIWKDMQVPPGAKPDVYASVLVYEKDGKRVEYTQEQFMADSTLWNLKYIESKTSLIEKGNATPKIQDFSVRDFAGQDYTESLLKDEGYSYLLFVKDADKVSGKDMDDLRQLIKDSYAKGIGFYILSANDEAATNRFKAKFKLDADAYAIDGTVCKTAMRSNGGLMLIKNGTILGKWSRQDYPKSVITPK